MRWHFLGLFLIIAISCRNVVINKDDEYTTNINLSQLKSEWTREFETWKSLNIQNYCFIYQLPDIYGSDWALRITVKNSCFFNAVNIETENIEDISFTIDDIFARISYAFDQDEKKTLLVMGI